MTTTIHPVALKHYRDRKHWTQEQLADATKGKNRVSLPTIKRIESARGSSYPANNRVAEGLAKALGVTVDNLAKPPTDEAERETNSPAPTIRAPMPVRISAPRRITSAVARPRTDSAAAASATTQRPATRLANTNVMLEIRPMLSPKMLMLV